MQLSSFCVSACIVECQNHHGTAIGTAVMLLITTPMAATTILVIPNWLWSENWLIAPHASNKPETSFKLCPASAIRAKDPEMTLSLASIITNVTLSKIPKANADYNFLSGDCLTLCTPVVVKDTTFQIK